MFTTRLFARTLATLTLAATASSALAQVAYGPVTNPANGHQYWVVQIANYVDYSIASANLGGYPVVINNAAENAWIFANLIPNTPGAQDPYIGLADDVVEGEWRCTAGVRSLYTNWTPGEPNNSSNEDFATMRRSNGTWNDRAAPGPAPLPYAFVEANPAGTQPTGIAHGPVCDPATGHVYYILSPSNFDAAEQYAASLGGHLATINSVDESDFVLHHLLRLPGLGTQVGIGLTDRASEGIFQWLDGSVSSYRRWAAGEPNNFAGNEDFAIIFCGPGADYGTWNDSIDAVRSTLVEVVPCAADFNRSGSVSAQDVFDFLTAFFTGCP